MSYCSPRRPNFGFFEHGCAAYGGLQFDGGPSCDNQHESRSIFIPKYNLARYWQRFYLEPHSIGFPSFLFRIAKEKRFNLPPGHWPFDTDNLQLQNRNLLTGASEDDTTVKLWCTGQQSDRRRIFEYSVRLKQDGITGEEWELFAKNGELTNEPKSVDVPSSLLELRCGGHLDGERYLFGRCEDCLLIVKPVSNAAIPIINTSVLEFSLVPYMYNEVILLDRKHLWFVDLETAMGLSRVKTSDRITVSSLLPPTNFYFVLSNKCQIIKFLRCPEKVTTIMELWHRLPSSKLLFSI